VVSCDAPGGRQAVGAVVGALLGAAVGNSVAKGDDRGTGRIAGALAGAAGGSYLGCKQQRDRIVSPQTYSSGYAPTHNQGGYDPSSAGSYMATSTLNVRAAPSVSAARIGSLGAGQMFEVVGRDGAWMVVNAGAGQGYVSAAHVKPADYRQARYGDY